MDLMTDKPSSLRNSGMSFFSPAVSLFLALSAASFICNRFQHNMEEFVGILTFRTSLRNSNGLAWRWVISLSNPLRCLIISRYVSKSLSDLNICFRETMVGDHVIIYWKCVVSSPSSSLACLFIPSLMMV
jgi:hypothetical protein